MLRVTIVPKTESGTLRPVC